MKKILFLPITFNLATTWRAIAIARAISGDFECHFASYGGEFESLIKEHGFPLTRLEPRITPAKIRRLYAIDQARWIGPSHSVRFVRQMVKNEIELYRTLKPGAVVTGMNPSTCISCPASGTPLVWGIHSGVAMETAAKLGKLKDMDQLDIPPINWLPDALRTKLSEITITLVFRMAAGAYNRVAVEYGLEPYRHLEDLFGRNFHLLAAEPAGFSDIPLPPETRFIGPLAAQLKLPLPDEVRNMPYDLPVIYFAMGSSGRPEVIRKILSGFAGKPYRVIAPVKRLLKDQPAGLPDNVLVTGWLPAHKVNPMADLTVIHGGIGTIMNACLAGKPVIGIAMSPEQFLNLTNLVRKGFAVRIPRKKLTADRLCKTIEQLLNDPDVRENARRYQKVVQNWNTSDTIRNFFLETFGENSSVGTAV